MSAPSRRNWPVEELRRTMAHAIYEFTCTCGARFEVQDPTEFACPGCGGSRIVEWLPAPHPERDGFHGRDQCPNGSHSELRFPAF